MAPGDQVKIGFSKRPAERYLLLKALIHPVLT